MAVVSTLKQFTGFAQKEFYNITKMSTKAKKFYNVRAQAPNFRGRLCNLPGGIIGQKFANSLRSIG